MKSFFKVAFCLSTIFSINPASAEETPFVVGGQDALPGEYPWQSLLYRNNKMHCGGSILNKRWVLTAAHCTDGFRAGKFDIYLGAHERANLANDPNVQSFKVAQIVTHPEWDSNTLEHDMALIELDSDITFNDYVQPIELSKKRPKKGSIAFVSGWGRTTGGGQAASKLQEGQLEIVDQQACADRMPSGVTDDMICAGFSDGAIGGCNGDSGGPLVYQSRDGGFSAGWRLAGVVSWGVRGCTSYTVFSDVTSQSDENGWIASTIGTVDTYGDIDGDACVDNTDYNLYLVNNGKSGADVVPAEADINGDGIVNYDDYVIIIQNWGEGCNTEAQ